MGGLLILIGFLLCGCVLMDGLVPQAHRLVRLWIGLCAGLILMMWLPVLFAFLLRFTLLAQLLGLALAALLAGISAVLTRSTPRKHTWTDMPIWLPLVIIVPLTLLGGWLQYTHTLREVDGALHVGQSTYGDLCLHLGIATSLRGASFPPDYSLLPGTLLGYPFLGDSMVTTMLLCGSGLTLSYVLTGTLMMALVGTGFVLFCWEVTHNAAATSIASAMMFVNGGLGFIYALDGIWKDSSAFLRIFTGFYATPTNQPSLNLRWVNVICDMMVPQRTLLTGWMALLPALWLLVTAVRNRDNHRFALLGIWAGTMPMIHTHSFLSLGLISLGAVVYCTLRASGKRDPYPGDQVDHTSRASVIGCFALYGGIALALSLPQLLTWAVPQTIRGGSLRLRFNWVNNQGNGRLIDGYCWFWIKNVGLIWLMMIPAAISSERLPRRSREKPLAGDITRMLGLGALIVYIVAELIQFQPNEYDNNKLFYVAYMAMMPAMGLYLVHLWKHLKGVRGRMILAAVFMVVSTLSGALSICREIVSDYRLFSKEEAAAACYVDEHTPADSVFLTGSQHNNAVAALAGRHIVCGTGSYLYFHGIDYSIQQWDERIMLEHPAENQNLMEKYDIDYVYISSYERVNFAVDEAWFIENSELLFKEGDVCVYKL